jgi:hypothetical protein
MSIIRNPSFQPSPTGRVVAPERKLLVPGGPRRQSFSGAVAPAEPTLPAGSHANIQLYNQNLPTSGTMVLDSGNFFFLLANAAPVNVLFIYATGATEIMNGLQAGSQIKRVRPWTRAQIVGTGGSSVNFWHGYEFSREDQTNFLTTIATIAGSVAVTPAAASFTETDHADVALAATSLDNATIAANALRHTVTVGSLSSNAPATKNLRVGNSTMTAAGGRGWELQPGQFITIPTPNAVYVANPDANAQSYWWVEL